MLADLEILARRLEQQVTSFEKLHADEMRRFEEQFAAYQRVQNDEVQMLRDELAQLKAEIAALESEQTKPVAQPSIAPGELTMTRRDFLTGNLAVPNSKSIHV